MATAAQQEVSERLPRVAAAAAALAFGVLAASQAEGTRTPAAAPDASANAAAEPAAPSPLPELLSQTGLFTAGSVTEIDARNLPFVPQYPLWTDGARKRRWIRLPEGAVIDAADPDAWQFPAGTRFWKEFSFGRRVETRYMERLADGSYRFATYVWSEDGSDARLVPSDARSQLIATAQGSRHEVPSESDCRACHEGRRSPVLGFGALQLSTDRDPNAVHREAEVPGGVDLAVLAARGLLAGFPARLLREPPRIRVEGARARAALGYFYGNCSGCHNAEGPLASLGLDFDQRVAEPEAPRALTSALRAQSRFVIPGLGETLRIAPGRPEESALAFRMGTRFPAAQMPPLGTRLVDDEALELVRDWITNDLVEVKHTKEGRP